MMRSMYSAISGIRAHQAKMDVVANNIANVNTVGFKASRVTFQEVLNQTISPAFAASSDKLGGMNAQQIGLGVSVASIDITQNESGVQRTDLGTDVAIKGDGYFIVSDGDNSFYTRAGSFEVDGTGNLVTKSGYKVCDSSGSPIVLTDYKNVKIDAGGNISGYDASGTFNSNIATVGLAKFPNSSGLVKVGGNLYRESANSGDVVMGSPGDAGFSELSSGYLEMSNVDLSQEFTDMIIAQRGFQANSRVITTSNNMLEELASIIR